MSEEKETARQRFFSLFERAAMLGVLRRAVFSKPTDPTFLRAVLTQKYLRGKEVWQWELFTADNKAYQKNCDPATAWEDLSETLTGYLQWNLVTSVGDCELRAKADGRTTLIGGKKLEDAMNAGALSGTPCTVGGNDREKKHILHGDEPFLRALGVSDAGGRVYDKKQAKFRQINRFLELLRDVEDRLPAQGVLRVCDLCCGKSYLSFAVYHYLTVIKGRRVRMTGVDLKPDVVRTCTDVAGRLGFDGLDFVCGDVGNYEVGAGEHVSLVVSLHACDVATDLVLNRAVAWQSEVILSTPCCHHELNHVLDCPPLDCIAEYSMLRQKLCDAATDAMRLLMLASHGYRTEALELIDPEQTPKNVMLRAVYDPRMSAAARAGARRRYEEAVRFFIQTEGEAQKRFLARGES